METWETNEYTDEEKRKRKWGKKEVMKLGVRDYHVFHHPFGLIPTWLKSS
jgi:phosphatidylserine decarboxylase